MQTMALDKTWKEITDAGFAVIAADSGLGSNEIYVLGWFSSSPHSVTFVRMYDTTETKSFVADSENGYPVYDAGE
jgi:hypothetical protein